MIQSHKSILVLIVMMCFSISSFAHYIWIETEGASEIGKTQIAKIFYGEFNEGKREIKGGRLEEVEGIESWLVAPNGQRLNLQVVKHDKYYKVTFTPTVNGTYTIIAINKVREIMDWSQHGIGVVKPTYYTSKQIIIGNGKLLKMDASIYPAMAIVPYKSENNNQPTFQLLFKNKPFAKTKLFVHAPNEWSKEYKTDANGVFSFDPLWKGLYVIECIYKEEKEGVYARKKYEAIRHRVTYTVENN